MRALVVTNMYPTPERPALGSFVRDQVEALRRRDDVEVELFAFPPGLRATRAAARELRRRYRARALRRRPRALRPHRLAGASRRGLGPVVVTLHGNDLFHPRSNRLTRAALPFTALPAAVSREFSGNLPGAGTTRRVAVLPVGIDLGRFRPIPRARGARAARARSRGPYLLFPHDPARPLKRFDRAREAAGDVPLLTMGHVPPDEVPYWINAANAVLVPSQAEGFGLAVIEALACGVPVLGTPGGHPPGRARRHRRARTARRGTPTPGGRRCGPLLEDARPARRRARAGGAVLGRPDGRAGGRGLARRGAAR